MSFFQVLASLPILFEVQHTRTCGSKLDDSPAVFHLFTTQHAVCLG